MTDATTGPGAEGAPRDGKQRGRATFPATPPGHDPATDPPTADRRGETAPSTPAPGRDATLGEPGARTAREGTGTPGGEPAGGATAPGADTARGREAGKGVGLAPDAGGLGGETETGRDSVPDRAGTRDREAGATPDRTGTGPAVTRDQVGDHGGPAGTHGEAVGARGREAAGAAGAAGAEAGGHESRLLPRDECDKLAQQLQHAVAGFVDGPRDAVEEADHVLEEAAARLGEAVSRRRRTLRGSWQSTDGGEGGKPATSTDTEQLRLALRDYRELADRLLHL
jgi:hypothetical protein